MPRFCIICCIVLFMALSAALAGLETTADTSDSTQVYQFADKCLSLLCEGNSEVTDYIDWGSFTYNGYDVSYDYWDAYDYGEEDYVTEDMISEISTELPDSTDAGAFTLDSISNVEGTWNLAWSNKVKSVDMTITKEPNVIFLINLELSNLGE